MIALVGRPNVGKSTLFNRLIGRRQAVVSSTRGTTRDRLYGVLEWRGVPLTLIDTGGVEFGAKGGLAEAIQRHVRRAVADADGVLLVCDASEGLVPADQLIMDVLRRTGKPVSLVVNKVDHRLEAPPEFFALGVSPALPVSALHGRGIGELLDAIVGQSSPRAQEPARGPASPAEGDMAVAIVGRQNVGKSSLFNAMLREERTIVNERPGTTRDAVGAMLAIGSRRVRFLDTAGLRHRRKVKDPVDVFSMARTGEALERCDVALIVLDATQGVTSDDRRILSRVAILGRGVVVALNKWDLVSGMRPRAAAETIARLLPMSPNAPVLPVSAKTGFQIPKVLPAVVGVARAMRRGLSDDECLALLDAAWRAQPPPRLRGRAIRLHGARWRPGRPPALELLTAPIAGLPVPYQHYLRKRLAALPQLAGVPIRLVIREPHPRRGR